MKVTKIAKWTAAAASMLLLGGCVNLAPDYERPQAPVAQDWPQFESHTEQRRFGEKLPPWREFILDKRLQTVIALGLERSRSLRSTALNVERARALYGVQRSALFPSIAARANENAQREAQTVSQDGRATTSRQYTVQLAMTSYELDFFGRVRNLSEQALQSYLQSEDALKTARSTLIAEIAIAWLRLGADRTSLALEREILRNQEEGFELMRSRYEHGTADRLEYEQARSTVEAARASIASYERAVAQDRNALELLTGGEVDETLLPQTLELKATLAAALPPGTPSEILVHRPDIQRAERQILSANAQIGAARAAFFPSVTLSAGAGTTAMTLSDLFDGGSGMWTFVPNINLPIFSGGRNVANLKSAEVAQKIAVSDYEAAIQTAFREVADALATEDTIVSEVNARTRYADSTRAAFVISEESYKAGTVSYTDVLTQQRAMVAAQQTLITAQLSMASSAVTLWKALGGGTELDESTEVATKGSEG